MADLKYLLACGLYGLVMVGTGALFIWGMGQLSASRAEIARHDREAPTDDTAHEPPPRERGKGLMLAAAALLFCIPMVPMMAMQELHLLDADTVLAVQTQSIAQIMAALSSWERMAMVVIGIVLFIPPKRHDAKGDVIRDPSRRGCLRLLAVLAVCFLCVAGVLFYAMLGFVAKSKVSSLWTNAKMAFQVVQTYRTENEEEDLGMPPLTTHIRCVGTVGDDLDGYFDYYFHDAVGKWIALVVDEKGAPQYILFSNSEITSYQIPPEDEARRIYQNPFRPDDTAIGVFESKGLVSGRDTPR